MAYVFAFIVMAVLAAVTGFFLLAGATADVAKLFVFIFSDLSLITFISAKFPRKA